MGEEYIKQGMERDRRPPFPGSENCDTCFEPSGKDRGGRPKEVHKECGCCDPCRPEPCDPCRPDPCDPCKDPCKEDEWDWGSWLPIILIILLLCGGGGFFGGGGRDECCDGGGFGGFGGGSSSWIIILVIIFLFCSNREGGKGGFLGGLF